MGEDEERFRAQTRLEGNGEHADSGASLDPDRERRYAELFKQLDLNKDGRVDINELRTALAARGLHQGEAEEVRQRPGKQADAVGQVHTEAKPPAYSDPFASALLARGRKTCSDEVLN